MESKPPIIVSSLDLARLEHLLESESYRHLPGMDALREELDRATVVEPIDLARIHAPLCQVAAEDDHIAPWRQTFRINGWVTGYKRFVLPSSGHILGIVNPPVMPPKRHFRVGRAHRGRFSRTVAS